MFAWFRLVSALAGAFVVAAAAFAADPPKETSLEVGMRPFMGDFDAMAKRRLVRVLVPFSKTFYYIERGRPRGVSAEIVDALEAHLNAQLKTKKSLRLRVVALPAGREDLIRGLLAGYGDVIVGDLTVTPARQAVGDFAQPMFTGVREIPVSGPEQPPLSSVDDLSGRSVFVRRDTSYWEHLEALNAKLAAAGKPPVKLVEAPPELEAEDILEMVNAGLVPMTVVDYYKFKMWKQVFPKLESHHAATVHDGGDIAFMIRKDSPKLKAALDGFVVKHREGTAFGNSIENRYAKNRNFAKNALGDSERKRFGDVVALFRKYGDRYDMDYLLMVAQGFQESTLDQTKRSQVGAIGVMQIMPATGKELKVGDINVTENNIHGGVKYMRFMMDQYFKDEPMTPLNKGLFTFAAYNCGPGRVAQLRKEAQKRGLDPNRWFGNVELVAADRIGPETVTYVSNIYKYYTAYKLLMAQEEERRKAREAIQPPPKKG